MSPLDFVSSLCVLSHNVMPYRFPCQAYRLTKVLWNVRRISGGIGRKKNLKFIGLIFR